MKESEARELLVMVKSATSQYALEPTTELFWMAQMTPLDADLAVKSVMIGVKEWKRFPSWAQFREVYKAEERKLLGEPVGEQRERLPRAGKHEVPEWVWVWSWARQKRDPREARPFPQQDYYVDATQAMSMIEYEKLHEEWVALGSPRSKNPLSA